MSVFTSVPFGQGSTVLVFSIQFCNANTENKTVLKMGLGFVFLVCCFGFANVFAFPAGPEQDESTLGKVYRVVQECSDKDLSICLKMRALTFVDKALRRSDDINIVDGVVFAKSDAANEAYRGLNARALSQDELDASLPKNAEEKNAQVENLLFDRVARFLETHTLQLKVPSKSISEMKRSLEEGNYII